MRLPGSGTLSVVGSQPPFCNAGARCPTIPDSYGQASFGPGYALADYESQPLDHTSHEPLPDYKSDARPTGPTRDQGLWKSSALAFVLTASAAGVVRERPPRNGQLSVM